MSRPADPENALTRLLAAAGAVAILDGGLATELERRGADLDDPLWSARALIADPGLIAQVHADYLAAGADLITSASYQASFQGFARRGLGRDAAEGLLRTSIRLAVEARDRFWRDAQVRPTRPRPLVAASIGPYGALLADGSEYRGAYGLGVAALMDFHRDRLACLAGAGADLLAFETIPSLPEAEALVRLLDEIPAPPAWLSFQCRDERRLADGAPLAEAVALADGAAGITALGVNCVPPRAVLPLLEHAREHAGKPLVAYPNSGERWDAADRRWRAGADREGAAAGDPGEDPAAFAALARSWAEAGAVLIGGCCRTGPEHIRAIARAFGRLG